VDSRSGEEKNLLLLLGIKPRFIGCPAHSLVITQTVLSLLPEITAGPLKVSFTLPLHHQYDNSFFYDHVYLNTGIGSTSQYNHFF
jgi:hypothetical protein